MSFRPHKLFSIVPAPRVLAPCVLALFVLAPCLLRSSLQAQTVATGVLAGDVVDASGAAVPSAELLLTNESTSQQRSLTTNALGLFSAPLLQPGRYQLTVSAPGFAQRTLVHIPVEVAGTFQIHARLAAGAAERVDVSETGGTDEVAPNLGSVTDHTLLAGLPLAARNYTQILGLNTGIAGEVANAGALGRGDTSYATGSAGFSSNGAPTNDNNFQMDGADVNDIQGSGSLSRGVPVPNPDAIEEFRVATQPYDASQGRNSGANINIVTRSGSQTTHGSLFEFFRNDALNANTYFRKATGQPRPALKQNQFGGTLGGPLFSHSIVGFGSYQETRQSNGLDPSCSSSAALPPLTDDRSAAGIGAVFQGQRGYFQNAFGGVGPSINADGSNIDPTALAILERKNPDGSFLIPTPQRIVSAGGAFDARGLSTFSSACPYTEHQGIVNVDWQANRSHHLAAHSFASDSSTLSTFPSPLLAGSTLPSSPFQITDRFRTISLADTWTVRPTFVNELRFGFNRIRGTELQEYPFAYSDVGATVPSFDNAFPLLSVAGASIGGGGNRLEGAINTFVLQNSAAYSRGRHMVHVGGGFERIQDNQPFLNFYGAALFLSFADFVLGQNAAENGTAAVCAFAGCGSGYSDVAYALDSPGLIQREYRVLSGNAYIQDDVRITPRLTVNIGFRYERLGDLADRLGHNTSFFPALADPNPPPGGTLQGYVVPKNYPGVTPAGVTRLSNNYGIDGSEQNTWQPRAGISWQLPGSDRLTLRAGAGLFRSRITADAYNQSVITPPFARLRQYQGTDPVSASLTLQQPLPPFTTTLPSFAPYCAVGGSCSETPVFNGLAPDIVPPLFQRYNLDLETRLTPSLTFDLGYVGARGQHLLTQVFINQAALASPSSPVNGVTSNTLTNLPERVPYPGFSVANLTQFQTSGSSFYNALQATLHKRSTRSGEVLLSYTWARDLTDIHAATSSPHGGTILGNQNDRGSAYGPDDFLRQQRFVATYLLHLPSPRWTPLHTILGNWRLAGTVVAQSGHVLTPTYQNQFSAYGITNDRPELTTGCNPSLAGGAEDRLARWFNTSCFTTPPVIGADGVSTGFGNAPIGVIHGPRQTNADASLMRLVPLHRDLSLDLRLEGFNVFNHPGFADPNLAFSTASFGQVLATSVNPRIVQLAVDLSF